MDNRIDRLEKARSLFQKYWKYPDFRPAQAEVIQAVLEKRDVLAILPTGGGKSVCYQVPALMQEGVTLVVSPLIALMQDQVSHLNQRGIPATFVNSTLTTAEVDQRWTDIEFGRYRLVFVAPERLQSEMFLARVERLRIDLLAVDEAHCISEWGHHFRPAYLEISKARALMGDPPLLAVTATATPEVRRDILEHLGLHHPKVIVKGFDRPGIVWSIFRTETKKEKVVEVLQAVPGCAILYAATRRSVEEWAETLTTLGIPAIHYHGGLSAEEREAAQERWIKDKVRVMVATNAFGMGIDKPDVRVVLHVDIPASLEAYYQEAGRAGRDGEKAYAVLLYAPRDEATQRTMIAHSHPEVSTVVKVYDAVCNLGQVPLGSLPERPLMLNLEAITRLSGFSSAAIQASVTLLERQEVWQVLPARPHLGYLRFVQPATAVREYAERVENTALAAFIKDLMRHVPAEAYGSWWEVDIRWLHKKMSLPASRLTKGLAFLEERALIEWLWSEAATRLELRAPRTQTVPVDDLEVRRDARRSDKRLNDMVRYARSVTCRRRFLLTYFGEASPEKCGKCDVCLGRHRPVVIMPDDEPLLRQILRHISQGAAREAWTEAQEVPEQHLEALIDWLIQEDYLAVTDPLEERFTVTERAWTMLEQWPPRSARDTQA